jgi:hypothetical protein
MKLSILSLDDTIHSILDGLDNQNIGSQWSIITRAKPVSIVKNLCQIDEHQHMLPASTVAVLKESIKLLLSGT